MSRLEEIFNKTISEYNENTSDINKFKFSQREKDIFKGMIRRYATECVKASLEKASKTAKIYKESCGISSECGCMGNCDYPISYINKKSITNPDNIILV